MAVLGYAVIEPRAGGRITFWGQSDKDYVHPVSKQDAVVGLANAQSYFGADKFKLVEIREVE